MATYKQSSIILLFLMVISRFIISCLSSGSITVYWGQYTPEGTLESACATGNYQFVNIAFLVTFGNFQTPAFNLANHCGSATTECPALAPEIKACQALGIKVLLSIGGASGTYTLVSDEDAQQVARYLWDIFLGGQSTSRPFGDAVLDGIDFDIEAGPVLYWDTLARSLKQFDQHIILSAAPQCPYPDARLNTAIQTGLFNFVWVQFYNNPNAQCQYGENADDLLNSWNNYWTKVPAEKVFVGLPASPQAANNGYIAPDKLISEVLPYVNTSSMYGGVMLWNRYYDLVNGYSDAIKGSV